jgi:hypothetical protein
MSNTAHDHDYTTGSVANHTHTGLSVGNAGGGGTAEQRTIDNRPAFYKLAIIIKTTPSDTYTPWSVEALEKPVTEKWQILGDNDEYLYSLIPKSGLIFIWSGLLGDIPAGYALCNGVGGRPDLRNKFILGTAAAEQPGGTGGAHSYVLTAYQMAQHNHGGSVGSAGGHSHTGSVASGTHDHPVSINTVGSHSHLASVWDFGSGLQTMITYEELVVDYWSSWVASAGSHSHGVTLWNSAPSAAHSHALSVGSAGGHGHTVTVNAIGSGASIDNRPKYRTVQFIMKT